jgi:hypothetical protein
MAEFGAAQFAASRAPLSLRTVPPICASIYGFVGLSVGGPMTIVSSGMAERTLQ